ncbi:hypothetical protein B0A49_13018 [Cryomyces minteri]|uniref:Uncharacterized protein n=1 Tax=Cryomyces minteri TaxID=331657 RepID=A0A4U0WPA9_9PEZI|nr:hypothetical protein B0A49_13018 [Cryomyces minteri]
MLALDEQPDLLTHRLGGYFFLSTYRLRYELKIQGKHIKDWTQDERDRIMQSYRDCFKGYEEYLEQARVEGKTVFVKEHSEFMTNPVAQTRWLYGQDSVEEPPWVMQSSNHGSKSTHSSLNETVLPDEILQTFLPTFLVRHPALVFPSRYRAMVDIEGAESAKAADAQFAMEMTLHWTRALFDWYAQNLKPSQAGCDSDVAWPLVLDANDVITEPDVVVRLCETVGMDPAKMQYTWEPASEEEKAQIPTDAERRFLSTLLSSTGIQKGKAAPNIDIAVEAKKWIDEFGEGEGEKIEKWVRAAMPDYEFLRARRLRPRPTREDRSQ